MTDIDRGALNRKVAEVIFGLQPCTDPCHDLSANPGENCYADSEYPEEGSTVGEYSRHPDYMQDVIDHFTDQDAEVTLIYGARAGRVLARIDPGRGESFSAGADDAPTAVCLVALLTKGELWGAA